VASLASSLASAGFGTFASKAQNGFVGEENCFVAPSRQNSRDESTGLKAMI
jgi:hypothetical protein